MVYLGLQEIARGLSGTRLPADEYHRFRVFRRMMTTSVVPVVPVVPVVIVPLPMVPVMTGGFSHH